MRPSLVTVASGLSCCATKPVSRPQTDDLELLGVVAFFGVVVFCDGVFGADFGGVFLGAGAGAGAGAGVGFIV